MSDPNREWLDKVSDECVKNIRNGGDNSIIHAVVMLHAKLCETELAFSVLKQSMDSIDLQLKNAVTSTYHTLIQPEDKGGEYDEQQKNSVTEDSEGVQVEPESFIESNI